MRVLCPQGRCPEQSRAQVTAMKLLQELRKPLNSQTNILFLEKSRPVCSPANTTLGLALSSLLILLPWTLRTVTGAPYGYLHPKGHIHSAGPSAHSIPLPLTWYLLTRSCLICSNFRFSSLCRSSRFCARPTYSARPLISFPFMSATACQQGARL